MLVFVSAPALSCVLRLAAHGDASGPNWLGASQVAAIPKTTCDLRGAPSCGPEFFEPYYFFRIPTHRRCYTPTANYSLVDIRIARSINPGVALTGLQPAANLVEGTPDVNRDT
jgi:hypothetical protein